MNKQNYGMGLPEGYEQLTYFVRANAPQYLINQIRAKFPEVNADSDLMISGDVKIVRDKRFKNGFRMEISENAQITPIKRLDEDSFMSSPTDMRGLPRKIEERLGSKSFYEVRNENKGLYSRGKI